jgi:hypothetical protein
MALWSMQVLTAAFLAVLFLQSGFDKVLDREGNLQWLTEHFSKSPLAEFVPRMLSIITFVEVTAGILSALGAFVLLVGGSAFLAFCGALMSGAAILMLFSGQRIAKDYAGAAVLVNYFLLVLVALFLFR